MLGLIVPPLHAAAPPADDVAALAARIDAALAARMAAAHVRPAPPADDAEFIRRAFLDLAGRIPSVVEARDFLDDDRPGKRRIWVDQLLAGDRYAEHFTNVWRAWLLPATTPEGFANYVQGFEDWLRGRLKENARYDALVRDLLTAGADRSPTGPGAFILLRENKPEELAANTARLFNGTKLECSQCHADPAGRWGREQFWSYAAFFTTNGKSELPIPGTNKTVRARFLDGTEPKLPPGANARAVLARWLTARENAAFAQATVNRVWAYLFGAGLVEPVDEVDRPQPGSHPKLLADIGRAFAAHDFDLKYLLRVLTATQAYQRSSAAADGRPADPHLFARMAVRPLTPEQLFESLVEATEYQDSGPTGPRVFGVENESPRAQFRARFAQASRVVEPRTTILQALFLMNGDFAANATRLESNRTLATVADTASANSAQRIETLYLVVLSRKPRPAELARLVPYVERGGPSRNPKKALADVYWALLNSAEFAFNH